MFELWGGCKKNKREEEEKRGERIKI